MKKISLFFFVFLTLYSFSIAQSLDFVYVERINVNVNEIDIATSVVTDNAGNVFFTGDVPTMNGDGNDIFVRKFDAAGNFCWGARMEGTGDGMGTSVKVSPSGDVYLAGHFEEAFSFDPNDPLNSAANLSASGSSGYSDIFIQKLDSLGNLVWVKGIGSINPDAAYSLALDNAENIYITGIFQGTMDFDPGTGTANLTPMSLIGLDMFVLKLDKDGNFLWVKQMGGTGLNLAVSIAVDGLGNVYTAGTFAGTIDIDPNAGTFNLSAGATGAAFLQKLDPAGNLLWAISNGGGASPTAGHSVTVDAADNILLSGVFYETVDFDPQAGISNLTAVDSADIYIQKLDPMGNLIWAKGMGGMGTSGDIFIGLDKNNNVYCTGSFTQTVDFDPNAGIQNVSAIGSSDIFILKLDTGGNFLDVVSIGGTANEAGNAITTDLSSNVYVAGYFGGTVDFDPGPGVFTETAFDDRDLFMLKLGTCFVDVGVTVTGPSITANSAAATYQWLDCNNGLAAISGETSQTFTATSNGDYAVEVIQGTCKDTSACTTVTILSVDNPGLSTLNLFPNPTTGFFKIELPQEARQAQVNIIDYLGKTVCQEKLTQTENEIDLSHLSVGVYHIAMTLRSGEKLYGKVLIE